MNKKLKIVLITIAAAIVLVIAAIVIASLVKPAEQTEVTPPPVVADTAAPSEEPEETPDETPEHVNTVTSTLAVGGDIVMHTGLNGEAAGDTGYDYVPIFGILKDFIANADYSTPTSAPWSHSTHPRPRCSRWKFFSHPGAAAPRSRCPC